MHRGELDEALPLTGPDPVHAATAGNHCRTARPWTIPAGPVGPSSLSRGKTNQVPVGRWLVRAAPDGGDRGDGTAGSRPDFGWLSSPDPKRQHCYPNRAIDHPFRATQSSKRYANMHAHTSAVYSVLPRATARHCHWRT